MQEIDITYYMHSGFSYAAGDTLLVFDYWEGERHELPEERQINVEFLRNFKEVFVFISHSHPDHYDPVVYEWAKEVPVTYVLGYDLPLGLRGNRLHPGDVLKLNDHLSVKAFDSTDLGVSFLVEVYGVKVFHAGDLNFWHWREESTLQEIEEADEAFHKAVEPIVGEAIDVSFFPVDPRQGMLYDAGANYFVMAVKPRILIPMHFWEKAEIATEFARRSTNRQTEIIAMTRAGEIMELDIEDDGFMNVNMVDPQPLKQADQVDIGGYENGDPFINTDLPVNMDE